MPKDAVEAMPAAQVIIVHTVRSYEDLRDDTFKWFFVPYPDGIEEMRAAQAEVFPVEPDIGGAGPLAKALLPAVLAIRTATVRVDREVAILRLVEALRIYGASHEGRLPTTLRDVTEVPIPSDPMTGAPFEYQLKGDKAVVQVSPLPGRPHIYEITMARP
jgi:hypothetical protein